MKKNGKLGALNARLKNCKPDHGWESDDGATLLEGQVWSVAGGCGGQPGWAWLILENIDNQSANFAPLATHAELAGPDDLFISIDRTGIPGIVMLELECTLQRDALGECLGRLPQNAFCHILDARQDLDDPVAVFIMMPLPNGSSNSKQPYAKIFLQQARVFYSFPTICSGLVSDITL